MKKHSSLVGARILACCAALHSLAFVSACSDDAADGGKRDGGSNQADAASADSGAKGDTDAGGGGGGKSDELALTAAKGGTLESDDGSIVLKFPAGAVKSDITVSVREATADDAVPAFEDALGKQYVFEPDGTKFEKPVEIEIKVERSVVDAAASKEFDDYVADDAHAYPLALFSASGSKIEALKKQSMDTLSDPDFVIVRGELSHFSSMATLPGKVQVYFNIAANLNDPKLAGPIGTTASGVVVVSKKEKSTKVNVFDVSFDSTKAASIEAGSERMMNGEDVFWGTTATCLAIGKGQLTANINLSIAQSITTAVELVPTTFPLHQPYDCTAKPAPKCEPATPAPAEDPAIETYEDSEVCRDSDFFIEGVNLSDDGTCFEVDGEEILAKCQNGSYCSVHISKDAKPGDATIKVRTGKGSATAEHTVKILDATPPTITGFDPESGAPGTTVTITGTNLTDLSSISMAIGNGPPFSPTLTDATATSVKFVIPQQATAGEYKILYYGSTACGEITRIPEDAPTLTVTSPL